MPDAIPDTYCLAWFQNAGPYGYQPSLAAGIVFTLLFAISAIAHGVEGTRARRWWQHTFTIGAMGTQTRCEQLRSIED